MGWLQQIVEKRVKDDIYTRTRDSDAFIYKFDFEMTSDGYLRVRYYYGVGGSDSVVYSLPQLMQLLATPSED